MTKETEGRRVINNQDLLIETNHTINHKLISSVLNILASISSEKQL